MPCSRVSPVTIAVHCHHWQMFLSALWHHGYEDLPHCIWLVVWKISWWNSIGNFIIPSVFLICESLIYIFRGVAQPPTRYDFASCESLIHNYIMRFQLEFVNIWHNLHQFTIGSCWWEVRPPRPIMHMLKFPPGQVKRKRSHWRQDSWLKSVEVSKDMRDPQVAMLVSIRKW